MPKDVIAEETESETLTDSDKFWEIMEHLGSAKSMLNVCHRSLSKGDSPIAGDEAEVLAEVIEKLRNVYNEFDEFARAAF